TECLSCFAKDQRHTAEHLRVQTASVESIDKPFSEGQFVVAALDVYEDSGVPGLTLQFAQSKHEPARGREEKIRAIGQFPLQASEIARAVEEVTAFNRGARDVSHEA